MHWIGLGFISLVSRINPQGLSVLNDVTIQSFGCETWDGKGRWVTMNFFNFFIKITFVLWGSVLEF